MNRHTFNNILFPFRRATCTKIFADQETYEMVCIRDKVSQRVSDQMVVVSTDTIFIPADMLFWYKGVKFLLDNIEAEYEMDVEMGDLISTENILKRIMPRTTSFYGTQEKITPLEYMMLMGSEISGNTIRMRFLPVKEEINIIISLIDGGFNISSPYGKICKNELAEKISLYSMVIPNIKSLYEIEFMPTIQKSGYTKEDSMMSLGSIMSNWTEDNFDEKKLKLWERNRHDFFGEVVCDIMGWAVPAKGFDVDIMMRFDYRGEDCHLTPDIIIETTERVYIFDFAVTMSNPGKIREEKFNTYENLRCQLMKKLNKEVIFDSIIWKINSNWDIQVPEEMKSIRGKLRDSSVLQSIYDSQERLSNFRNYERLRSAVNREDDRSMLTIQKVKLYAVMVTSLTNCVNLKNKKTYDIDYSRGKGDQVLRTLTEMNHYQELKDSKTISEEGYLESIKVDMLKMCKEGNMPDYMKSILTFDKNMVKEEIERQVFKAEETRMKAEESLKYKTPKLFKFATMNGYSMYFKDLSMPVFPSWFEIEHRLKDGTSLLRHNSMLERLEKEDLVLNLNGIGINEEEDVQLINEVLEFMMEKCKTVNFNQKNKFCYKQLKNKSFYKELTNTNMWAIMEYVGELMKNLAYLDGRRHLINSADGHTVMKRFDNYYLFVRKGSKLAAEKQIRYKLVAHKNDVFHLSSENYHKWTKFRTHKELVQTKWLTISITDIRHFLKIRQVAMGITSDYVDKACEMTRMEGKEISPLDQSLMVNLLILMEHKRGTSTANQLNRYLFHSALGYITWREKLIKDVMSDPIRSKLDSYLRICQLRWYEVMMDRVEGMWKERIMNMDSTTTEYDRLIVPSFYNTTVNIEFSSMMNEIYVGNLFDKESGFFDHRLKRIVAKMSEAEKHFMSVREQDRSKGNITDMRDFVNSKDEHHTFDKCFVVAATKMFFKNKSNKLKVQVAMMESLTEVINSAMMMTSSLLSGPLKSKAMEYSRNVEKSKSFLTLYDEVNNLDTHLLLGMISQTDVIDAIFTIFPKAQIGGAREILIQSVKLRYCVKFLEVISKNLCKIHPKEMLTKDSRKTEIQSETMQEYKDDMSKTRKRGIPSLYCSINADASRWSPAFVMENFTYFVMNWDIDESVKDFLLVVIISFAHKSFLVPDRLKDKWARKPKMQKEYDENIEAFREMSYSGKGVVILFSGMGQGMFHFLSSFYHCVIDDMVDMVIQDVLKYLYQAHIKHTTLISSDDKTKMILFNFTDPDKADLSVKSYVLILEWLYKLANIHMNWKKSALHFTITEFNSLFSVGKRMCWATIKDLYTANSLPDLTCPEEAVSFMISNIRRCMEHGVYLPTLEVLSIMARDQLMSYYRLDEKIINKLCEEMKCKEDDLPHQMGFYPTTMIMETLIYGPDIHMFKSSNSKELNDFYKGLYTANVVTREGEKLVDAPFSETTTGKFWLELPTKLDKRLHKLKKNFFKEGAKMSVENIMKECNKMSLNSNSSKQDFKDYRRFTREYFIGMNRKYEFQETMVIHSLVRALQITTEKATIYPRSMEMHEVEDELRRAMKLRMTPKKIESIAKRYEKMKNDLTCDLLKFAKFIRSRSELRSSLKMLEGLAKVVMVHEENNKKLEMMNKSYKNSHPSMKTVRFFSNDIGINSSNHEILQYMFEPGTQFNIRVSESFRNLMKSTNTEIDHEQMVKNPFKVVKDMMKDSKHPFKAFKDYMSYYNKNLRFVQIDMMLDTFCAGNMSDNLLNLYRYRGSPSYILMDLEKKDYSNEESEFLTKVSLGEMSDFPEEGLNKIVIGALDTPLSYSIKLARLSLNKWSDSNQIYSEKCFFFEDRKKRIKMWSMFSACVLCVNNERENLWYFFSDTELFDSHIYSRMMNLVDREMIYYESIGQINRMMTNEKIMNFKNLKFDTIPMKISPSFHFKELKWTINLTVSLNNITDKSSFFYNTFRLFSDTYSMDKNSLMDLEMEEDLYFSDLLRESMEIQDLDRMFLDKKWIKRKFLVLKSEKNTKENMEDIKDYNSSFGNMGLLETVGTVMGNNRKLQMMMEEEEHEVMTKSEEDMENVMGKELMESARRMGEMLREITNRPESEEEGVEIKDRVSVINFMDKIVSDTFKQSVNIDTQVFRMMYRSFKKNDKMEDCHSFILKSLEKFYDNELSDGMLMILYNIVIKKMSHMVHITPYNNIRKLMVENIPDKFKFLKSKKEVLEADDFVLDL